MPSLIVSVAILALENLGKYSHNCYHKCLLANFANGSVTLFETFKE